MVLADTEPELELVTETVDTEFKHDRHTVKRQPYIKKTLKIDYNNKTFLSYEKNELRPPFNLDFQERHFISIADPEQPFERIVTKIVRLKAQDPTTPRKELKEYLMWYENWFGRDYMGRRVPPVTDHIEGLYMEQDMEPVVHGGQKVGERRIGEHAVYYVPFSKAKVEEIIKGSNGTYKENIIYVVKTRTHRNDDFSYDQFVNMTFDELEDIMAKPSGPNRYPYDKTKRQYS